MRDVPVDAPSSAPDSDAMIRIGSRVFNMDDLIVIRTEEHYLSIVTRGGKWIERAKLSSLQPLLASSVGMQINRSVWIARTAIVAVEDAPNGALTVRLVNGDEERVARLRAFAFRQFYETADPLRPSRAPQVSLSR